MNHNLGVSQGGGPKGRMGGDSSSPETSLLHCGKPMGGIWGWVQVHPRHTGLNSAGLLSLSARDLYYAVLPPQCDITLYPSTRELPQTLLGSSARAWPPQPGSIGITCVIVMLLIFIGLINLEKNLYRGGQRQDKR